MCVFRRKAGMMIAIECKYGGGSHFTLYQVMKEKGSDVRIDRNGYFRYPSLAVREYIYLSAVKPICQNCCTGQ